MTIKQLLAPRPYTLFNEGDDIGGGGDDGVHAGQEGQGAAEGAGVQAGDAGAQSGTEGAGEGTADNTQPITMDTLRGVLGQFGTELIQHLKTADEGADTGADLGYNPVAEARQSIRIEEQMVSEVTKLHPTLPEEGLQTVRNWIGGFQTLEDLQNAQKTGLHRMMADHAANELQRAGRYVPGKRIVSGETFGQEPLQTSMAQSEKQTIDSMQTMLGVQFTEEDLAEARRLSFNG